MATAQSPAEERFHAQYQQATSAVSHVWLNAETRWETLLSDVEGLCMVSLHHAERLAVIFKNTRQPTHKYALLFHEVVTYRSRPSQRQEREQYTATESAPNRVGRTCIVHSSSWAQEFEGSGLTVGMEDPSFALIHFRVVSENAVVEVLANDIPEVRMLGDQGPPASGQSQIFFVSEDGEAIDLISKDT